MSEHFKRFSNRECEYYPCHKGADPEAFSCLFCYCPLYALGRKCGGAFTYANGVKDCSACLLPHVPDNYDKVITRYEDIMKLVELVDAMS